MAYTRTWDETQPLGSALASTIDDIFRTVKVDLRERLAGIFGMSAGQFAADPIAPISLTLSGALIAGSLSGPLTGNVTGTATALATPRAINGVNFDGTAAITVPAAAGTLTGATLAAGVTASSLTSLGILTGLNVGSGLATFQQSVLVNNGGSITMGTYAFLASYIVMGSATQTGAISNTIIFPNDVGVVGCNATNTVEFSLVKLNTSNQVEIGTTGTDIKLARNIAALGGGATATMGTIGGSGPTASAQASWIPVRDSAGNARFIPIWG